MSTVLLIIIAFLILTITAVAMYCTMIVAGRSDDQTDMDNSETDDNTLFKKQICSGCKTGKYTYDLDHQSDACPHIWCWEDNKCPFYKSLKKKTKKDSVSMKK